MPIASNLCQLKWFAYEFAKINIFASCGDRFFRFSPFNLCTSMTYTIKIQIFLNVKVDKTKFKIIIKLNIQAIHIKQISPQNKMIFNK